MTKEKLAQAKAIEDQIKDFKAAFSAMGIKDNLNYIHHVSITIKNQVQLLTNNSMYDDNATFDNRKKIDYFTGTRKKAMQIIMQNFVDTVKTIVELELEAKENELQSL